MKTFAAILERIEQIKQDYASSGFEKLEMAALSAFFDLAQEYDSLDSLNLVSVAVPRVFFGLRSNLYMIDPKTEAIKWVANSHPEWGDTERHVPHYIRITEMPYQHGPVHVVPIYRKKTPAAGILSHRGGDTIGLYEVTREDRLTDGEVSFVQKYVNWVGHSLGSKFLAEQNIQHLKFINNLVADIEHNVIVPNLRYKHYFKEIRKYLNINKEMESELDNILDEVKDQDPELYARLSETVEKMVVINRAMFRDQEKIERHYKNASLFLETLLRPDHFLFGEYILKKASCYFWQDIVVPQLQRYRDLFVQQGIVVDHMIKDRDKPDDIEVKADRGLMAQVVANLLSNAAKYAEWVDVSGKRVKKVDCTASLVETFFSRGHHGVRFDVFSSGSPIDQEDAVHIFDEGFRVTQKHPVEGTGHGLQFVKNVVEVHGGIVGLDAENHGNHFYFVIPA
ncbi:MAG: HAMP domain-containing sensor histidine kinase [Deltaproteobacteria bacterium]|jgi:signal transduction histidine kinase